MQTQWKKDRLCHEHLAARVEGAVPGQALSSRSLCSPVVDRFKGILAACKGHLIVIVIIHYHLGECRNTTARTCRVTQFFRGVKTPVLRNHRPRFSMRKTTGHIPPPGVPRILLAFRKWQKNDRAGASVQRGSVGTAVQATHPKKRGHSDSKYIYIYTRTPKGWLMDTPQQLRG